MTPITIISTIITLLLSLAGLYYAARRTPNQIRFQHSSTQLISSESVRLIDDLEVRVKNKVVENVSLTKFIIWNESNKAIREADLNTDNPLQICSKDGEFLSSSIERVEIESNNVRIAQNDGSLHLKFDYLNKNNGFRIAVLHTGLPYSLFLKGDIVDIRSIKRRPLFTTSWIRAFDKSWSIDPMFWFMLFLGICGVVLGPSLIFKPEAIEFLQANSLPLPPDFQENPDRQVVLGLFMLFVGLFLGNTTLSRYKPPSYSPDLRDKMFKR